MSIASPITTALLIALVLGIAASAWLWLVQHRKVTTALGLRALAAMRWRESSGFIVRALEEQGFSASRLAPDADRGQNADLLLNRDDGTWLLSCKQGVDYRIDSTMVSQLVAAVRDSGASGGILATLGRVQADARKNPQGIELIDGATLWPLVEPLLPPSLHDDLMTRARRRTVRATGVAWLLALVVGFLVASALPVPGDAPSTPSAPPAGPASTPAAAEHLPADSGEPGPEAAPQVASEDEQRRDIAKAVTDLPGIRSASWATRSTLVAATQEGASEAQIDAICAELHRYEALRISRVQLQPPPGSDLPVRFLQCRLH